MPEEKKTKKPTDSKEEIRKTLEGILAVIEKKKAAAKVAGNSSKPWGWVAGLVLAVLVFIALAFAAWSTWKKGREIAKLKHKVDLDEEKRIQAQANAKVTANEKERIKLEKEALSLKVTTDINNDKILWSERERKTILKKIDAITSWEDIDNL